MSSVDGRRPKFAPMLAVTALALAVVAVGWGCKASDGPPNTGHDLSETSTPVFLRPNPNVPHLQFTNQEGNTVSLSGLVGKPVLISFIYTRCPMMKMCPLTTRNVAEVQHLLTSSERATVALVSLTFDPEFDTPRVLKEYGETYGADFDTWEFWTGSEQDTTDLMDVYGAWAKKSGDDFDHNMRSVILHADGSFAMELRGSDWDATEAADRLRKLLDES